MANVIFRPLSATRVHLLRQSPLVSPVLRSRAAACRNLSSRSHPGRRVVLLLDKAVFSPESALLRCRRQAERSMDSMRCSFRLTPVRAAHVNDAGSVDSPLMLSMEKKIKENLEAESVTVKDAYGDGRHVSIEVVASCFEGQSAVNRQRMVYKAIWEELQSTVHAVDQMTTRTPAEAADK